jgi:hypothetical protein
MKHTLVVQSYGSENEYRRAVFSIWSFFAWSSGNLNETEAFLYTDQPDYFNKFLNGLPLVYFKLGADELTRWRGTPPFVHRVKIEVIKEAFSKTNGDIIYVDSDTAFVADYYSIQQEINERHIFMHKHEYRFKEMVDFPLPAGKPLHEFYAYVTSKSFSLSNGESSAVSPDQISWNAGAIMLTQVHRQYLDDVLRLSDQFYQATYHHGCEQYAFSIIMGRNAKISSCEQVIFHYWPVVQKKIADFYLSEKITPGWAELPLDVRKAQVKDWSIAMPRFVANHVMMLRDMAVQHFHKNNFTAAWPIALRVLKGTPWDRKLWGDLLHHLKRNILYLCDRLLK